VNRTSNAPALPLVLMNVLLIGGSAALPASADVVAAAPGRSPTVTEHHDPARITVKFNDGLHITTRDGVLIDQSSNTPLPAIESRSGLRGGIWQRTHHVSEQKLNHWRQTAAALLGKSLPDLNLQFDLLLPADVSAQQAIDGLNALEIVEHAQPIPLPAPAPLPPDFLLGQGYLRVAPGGVDAIRAWEDFNATGTGIKIADIEYSWNFAHQDLPAVTLVGPAPVDPFNNNNHGTAILGILASPHNGWGTSGIAHGSQMLTVAAQTASGYNLAASITTAMSALSAGDVLLVEQQIVGPNGGAAYVPVEWFQPVYDAIVLATGNGIIVVEPAGDGNQNLDAPIYSTGNGGHWPFLPQNDSGALIVGAGAAYQIGSDVDRSRLGFSTYGSTVDLQGWGEQILTTGYGTFYAKEGVNLHYTSTFGGTSGAAAIVAGSAAVVQGRIKAVTGTPYSAAQMRTLLQQTGSPQQAGTHPVEENIGPRPNILAALGDAGPVTPNDDCAEAPLKGNGAHFFTTADASTDGPSEPGACADGGFAQLDRDIWFKYLANCTGTATVSVCGATFDTKIAIYTSCPSGPGESIACNDDFCGTSSQVTFPVSFNTLYRIRIGGKNNALGTGFMVLSCTAGSPCPADINGDQQVNVIDLLTAIGAWGACPAPCAADTNNDGQVNVADLLAIVTAWGPCP
jgi:serine protease